MPNLFLCSSLPLRQLPPDDELLLVVLLLHESSISTLISIHISLSISTSESLNLGLAADRQPSRRGEGLVEKA